MTGIGLRLTLASALFVFASVATCGARERTAAGDKPRALEAKLVYCKTCHGLAGEGYRGYFPMPRLAGQQPEYIVNQLRAFLDRRRLNPVMANVAHGIEPGTIDALASHFRALNPAPFGGAPNGSAALGKTIFDVGVPESNIPACSACHGPDARGQNEIPRLAGQLYWYTVKALTNWSKERGRGGAKDTSAIMAPTSHNLTPAQVSAIASYVSSLK